ncbi:MAG: autotransporter outer membrane beta-barrel domain-containing protein, partial [Candidatus Accumulibacter sp.]|nr:autotransporter outer membrane beta-barrel domain-containing protein [Accumulibacter sp.]
RTFYLYDPVSNRSGDVDINKSDPQQGDFTGTVLFDQYRSNVTGDVTVHNGTMILQNGASIGAAGNTGTFKVDPGATLVIAYEQERTIYTPKYGDMDGKTWNDPTKDVFLLGIATSTETPVFTPGVSQASHIEGDADFTNANLRFLLPQAKLDASTPMLTVSGDVNVEGAAVNMAIPSGAATYRPGDEIYLITGAGTLSGVPANSSNPVTVQGKQGATITYDFQIKEDDHDLIAWLPATSPIVNPETPLIPKGSLGAVALNMAGLDMASGLASQIRVGRGRKIFALVSGADTRYNAGSHVHLEGATGMVGVSDDWTLDSGDLSLTGFYAHGSGDYRTTGKVGGDTISARGDASYRGAGLLARIEFNGDARGYPYLEGSLQGGQSRMSFHSRDLTDIDGTQARYRLRTPYAAAHLAGGYVWNMPNDGKFEAYANYFVVRRDSDKTTLSTGDPIEFSAVTAQRVRLGVRRNWLLNKRWRPFIGLAVEEEFFGKARATTHGEKIDPPEIRGTNGVGEVGLRVAATEDEALMLNLALHGYVGDRRGGAGMFRAEYRF